MSPQEDHLFGVARNLPKIIELDLVEIKRNPDQPRKTFDEAALRELAASIERHGLIQPVTVQRLEDGSGYLLVAGERRLRAFELLERTSIPAIVTKGDADEIALVENVQRQDLNPIEEAEALARLAKLHNYTQDDLSQVVGKARNTISELLILTILPDQIKNECRTSDIAISKSVLIEIARVKEPEEQINLWEQAKHGRVTVRAARQKKETGEVPSVVTPALKMLSTGRSFIRKLKRLSPDHLSSNRDHYRELLKLRAEIDSVLQNVGLLPEQDATE